MRCSFIKINPGQYKHVEHLGHAWQDQKLLRSLKQGGLKVQGLPGLQSEFKASLGNLTRPRLKIKMKGLWMEFSGDVFAYGARCQGSTPVL